MHSRAFRDEVSGFAVEKRKTPKPERLGVSGAAIQIRTGDLILTKDALYLLSYSSIFDSFDIIARDSQIVNCFFDFFHFSLASARRRGIMTANTRSRSEKETFL